MSLLDIQQSNLNKFDELEPKLKLYFIQRLKQLVNNNTDIDELSYKSLYDLVRLAEYIGVNLPNDLADEENVYFNEFKANFTSFPLDSIRNVFKKSIYFIFLNSILSCFSSLNKQTYLKTTNVNYLQATKKHLINLMASINYSDSFDILYNYCTNLKPSHHKDFCLYILKQFLNRHLMRNLLLEKTFSAANETPSNFDILEDELVQKICNIPDKLSILSNEQAYVIFLPKNYFKIILADLWVCLKHIHSNTSNVSSESLKFLSDIFGKISFFGYSEMIFEHFLKNIITSCYCDERWQKLTQDLLCITSFKYLDSLLMNLIVNSSCHQDVSIVLGDSIIKKHDIKYFLIDKFLFLKIMKKDTAIQNLIGYLCDSPSRKPLYLEVFKNLLDAWCNQTSIVNTSYDQHLYLTKSILVCLSFIEEKEKDIVGQDLMKLLLRGVQRHLHSPIENLRILGMIVGENLMNELNPFGSDPDKEDKKLKFEYEKTAEIVNLQSLRSKANAQSIYKNQMQENDNQNILNDFNDLNVADVSSIDFKNNVEKILFNNESLKIKITSKEHDSDDDDDLIPFDLSNDTPLSKTKQPAYLRDCLDALIYSDEPDKVEISMKSVEKLCDKFHYELEEICVELLKVILNKTNSYNIEGYEETRLNAMISITTHYPKEAANFLTSQFYEAGYTISQRTDIIHVLATSVQKLSNPNEEAIYDKRIFLNRHPIVTNLIPLNANLNNSIPITKNWKEIVQKRIESKTKIKKTTRTAITHKEKENKFSDVFGHFFFPLLRCYDLKIVHMNLMGQDFMLLGKLIFSLTVILYSSENTKIIENMISAFVDFLWNLRNHEEPYVRKSILYGFTLILLVISKEQLFSSLNNYFIEMKYWLETIILNDPNTECQKMAIDCMNILSQRIKEQFNIPVK